MKKNMLYNEASAGIMPAGVFCTLSNDLCYDRPREAAGKRYVTDKSAAGRTNYEVNIEKNLGGD